MSHKRHFETAKLFGKADFLTFKWGSCKIFTEFLRLSYDKICRSKEGIKMKYFLDEEKRKVKIVWVSPTAVDGRTLCWDIYGNELSIKTEEIFDDGEENFVEVSIPIEVPNGFVPPEKFHENRCMWCPFYYVDDCVGSYCGHKLYEKQSSCPIRKCFKLK